MNKLTDNTVEYSHGVHYRVVCAQKTNGTMPAKKFIESLDKIARTKILRLFDLLCQNGKIMNTQKFKKLHSDSELWEFKSKPYRIITFRDGNTWFLTHGFEKDSDGTRQEDIDKGKKIKLEHLSIKS